MKKFLCWEEGECENEGFEVEATDPQTAAEEAAEYDQYNCDGWERLEDYVDWYVRDLKGVTRLYEVFREAVPHFYATQKPLEGEE